MCSDNDILKVLEKFKNKAPIVSEYKGYVILAHGQRDLDTKLKMIKRGDTLGYHKITDFNITK